MITGDFILFYIFIFGLIIGSFLNVCIYRLPRGESITFPPSQCIKCGHRIAVRDLIPLFSYFRLKGKCRHCGQGISPLYPLVEVLTGLLFAAMYLHYGLNLLFVKYLFLSAVLIVLFFIDLKHYLIPNKIIIFALIGGALLNILTRNPTMVSALSGLFLGAAFLLLPAVVSRGGMGGGDIKLAAVVGFYLGWPYGLLAVFLGCLVAGLAGLVLILARIKSRKDAIPLGPFIAIGVFITIFRGNELLSCYI